MFPSLRRWLSSRKSNRPQPQRKIRSHRKSTPQLEQLEDRILLSVTSPPDQLLPLDAVPVDVDLALLNGDLHQDMAVLGSDGQLTTAFNDGADGWVNSTTTALGITAPVGMAFGYLDANPFADLLVQTPDGVLIAQGDGSGRFGHLTTLNLGPAGVFAPPMGAKVEPAVGFLAGDIFTDVVLAAPGNNEVIILRGDGQGHFATPVRMPSGGVQPVSVVIGQFLGTAEPDLAVGHRDGTVTFFEGHTDGSFTAQPSLTVSNLGTIQSLEVGDLDGNGETDLLVTATDRATVLLNGTDPTPTNILSNGDFSQGLTGWSVDSGVVSGGGGFAQFREGNVLLSSLRQTFVVPAEPTVLSFDLVALALEAPVGFIPDAFEAALLDAGNNSLVPTFTGDATAFFNVNPGNAVSLAAGVTFDGQRVTVDISGLTPGTTAALIFDLIANAPGNTSVASIDNVTVGVAQRFAEQFTTVSLAGPFTALSDAAVGDVDGDGQLDIVLSDGNRLDIFNGLGDGTFTRTDYEVTPLGTGAGPLAVAPLTAADDTVDVAVGLTGSNAILSPLTPLVTPSLDQGPRLAALTGLTGSEGQAVTLEASFSDPDAGAPCTATVDWGDGTAVTAATVTFASGSGSISAQHNYADNGTYTIRLVVTSANNGPLDYQETTAVIANTAPVLLTNPATSEVGSDADLHVASFSDAGFTLPDFRTRETFLATIDWGDGTLLPFGRLEITNGSAGTATTGEVFGSHRYTQPGIYLGSITVTDDDGGTHTQNFTITVRPKTVNAGVWWVPGTTGEQILVQFDFLSRTTASNNELGYHVVEDAQGRVAGLLPGDPGYREAVLASPQRGVLFQREEAPGALELVSFPAGTYVGFYLVQDGTTADWENSNPSGGLTGTPHVWFSTAQANADGASHFQRTDLADGWVHYDTEEGDQGGNGDFNDLVFQTGPAQPTPAIQNLDSSTGAEGQSVTFAGNFTDPEPNDSHTVSIDWGDGTTSPGSVSGTGITRLLSGTHVYADNGTYTITVTVTDAAGRTDTDTTLATITNVAPTLTAAPQQTTVVEQSHTFSLGTFTDPGFTLAPASTEETFTATVDWGDGTGAETAAVTFTPGQGGQPTTGSLSGGHIYLQPGTYTVLVYLLDDDLGETTASFQVQVTASAPVLGQLPTVTGTEGSTCTLQVGFTDTDALDQLTAVIQWGDGTSSSGNVTFTGGAGTVTGSHIYADNGNYTVTVVLTDKFNLSDSDTTLATIANVAPTLDPVSHVLATVNEALTLGPVTFSDPGFTFAPAQTQETFTATINWGDGTGDQPATVTLTQGQAGVLTVGQITATHTYTTPGAFNGTLIITDDDLGSGFRAFTVNVSGPDHKFFVVDKSRKEVFAYGAAGDFQESWDLAQGNSSARGITSNADKTRLWTIESNRDVFVYSTEGTYLGTWQASGANSPEDIATDNVDIWVLSDSADRVYRYAGAATRLSGTANPTDNFALAADNAHATGMVLKGNTIWVLDNHAHTNKVFVYTRTGTFLGNWTLDAANDDPTGITLDPVTGTDLWVVDRKDARVYRYADGQTWRSGSHNAASSFALQSSNNQAEGIADPDATPINFGDVVASDINPAGEQDSYLFEAVAGQQIFFNALQVSSPNLYWALQAPSGDPVFDQVLSNRLQTVAETGTYVLTIEERSGGTASYQFTLDADAPQVSASTLQAEDVLSPGPLTVVLTFSRAMLAANLDDSDFTLQGQLHSASFAPLSFGYSNGDSTLTINYPALPEDRYTLTLFSGASSFTATNGLFLDGDNDGLAGEQYVVDFSVDDDPRTPGALSPQIPPGSSVYTGSTSGILGSATDADDFTLTLDPGQTLTVLVSPTATTTTPVNQWASSVLGFSSQYSGGGWSAAQATGAPNTFFYGDVSTSWAPGPINGTLEYITLGYATPMQATGVTIRETYGNGFVYRVDLLDANNLYHTVWTGADPSQPGAPANFALDFATTPYLVQGVKVFTDTNHNLGTWEEIDAVELRGVVLTTTTGNLQPTVEVRNSSGTILGTTTASAAGMNALLQTVSLSAADTYTVRISGANGMPGSFVVQAVLNAAQEAEAVLPGVGNDTAAQAQDLAGAFAPLGTTSAERAAVLGTLEATANPADWYALTLNAGDSLTLGLTALSVGTVEFALYDGSGNLQAFSLEGPANVSAYIADFTAPASGVYHVQVTGTGGTSYDLLLTRNASFDLEPNSTTAQAQPVQSQVNAGTQVVTGYLETAGVDVYAISLAAGAVLQASTQTPHDGSGAPDNTLNPRLRLLDSSGTEVAIDDNSAPDGRNALLSFTAVTAGTYYVEVSASPASTGEYILSLNGQTPAAPVFSVTSTTPNNGVVLVVAPPVVTVHFNDIVLASSVDAADFQINGNPATGFTIVDATTIDFTLPGNLPEGVNTITIANILDAQGTLLQGYSGSFTLDTQAPRIMASSLQQDDTVSPGALSIVLTFNESMNAANLDASDFALVGQFQNATIAASSFAYSSNNTILTLHYANLAEDRYTLTLVSAAGRFTDVVGFLLDGEASFPLPPNQSGDGVPGGNFVVNFGVDGASQTMTTSAVQPSGTLVYQGSSQGLLGTPGDTDNFTVNLDAGQSVSVLVTPTSVASYNQWANYVIGFSSQFSGGAWSAFQATGAPNVFGYGDNPSAWAPGPQNGAPQFLTLGYNTPVYANGVTIRETLSNGFVYQVDVVDVNDVYHTVWTGVDPSQPGSPVDFTVNFPTTSYLVKGVKVYVDINHVTNNWEEIDAVRLLGVNLPPPDLQPTVQFLDATQTVLGSATAAGVNQSALLQTIPINTAGTYTVAIGSAGGTLGGYTVQLVLNAALEEEAYLASTSNDMLAAAQNLDDAFVTVGAVATRAAVLGRVAESGDSGDHYSFTASAGDTLSLGAQVLAGAPVDFRLQDASGNDLALGLAGATNVSRLLSSLTVPATGTYYLQVTGGAGSSYHLFVVRNAEFDREDNGTTGTAQAVQAQFSGDSQSALGYLASPGVDVYAIELAAGASFQAATQTPLDGTGQPVNTLNPKLRLLNATGAELANDDNSAPDGRNALLSFTAVTAGTYYVEVSSSTPATAGEYLLTLTSQTTHVPGFFVASIAPGTLATGSTSITLNFSDALLLSSVQPEDLLIDGVPADSVTVVDGDTLTFQLAAPLSAAPTITLAAGSLLDVQGTPVQTLALAPVAITLGQQVQDSITLSGLERFYTFAGTAGMGAMLDINDAGNNVIGQEIWRPDGTLLLPRAWGDRDVFFLDEDGTYTIRVGSVNFGTQTGAYDFTLRAVPAEETRATLLNVPVAGTASQSQRIHYTFSAQAGEPLLFDVLDNPGALRFTLQAPSGAVVFGSRTDDLWLAALPETGAYTLTITAWTGGTGASAALAGAFRFQLQELPTPFTTGTLDSQGAEFWIGFPSNFNETFIVEGPADLKLYVASQVETSGIIHIPGLNNFRTSFYIPAGGVATITLPPDAEMTPTTILENKGIHILAFDEVSVYGINHSPQTTDAFLALPLDVLGTEYVVMSYPGIFNKNGSSVSVVAQENGTVVEITPTDDAIGHAAGVPFTVTLNQGQTFQLMTATRPLPGPGRDLTGTRVSASKPVSVYGANFITRVPDAFVAADHLVEQMLPVETWGQRFVTSPLATRFNGDRFRILAAHDSTEVRINGSLVATLNRSQFYETVLAQASEIEASEPILVAQFSQSQAWDNTTADPFMMLLPPYEQFQTQYIVAAPTNDFPINYINIVAPTTGAATITLDGAPLPLSAFTAIGTTDFSYARMPVAPGSHALGGLVPFGVTVYGFATFDSYGYPGGLSLGAVSSLAGLTMTPEMTTGMPGTPSSFVVTLRNTNNDPVAGVRVDFVVTGVNSTSGFAVTDALGRATFVYTGLHSGLDTVQASAGALADTSTIDWLPLPPPTVTLESPADGDSFATGSTVLLTGVADAGSVLHRITLVTINGQPVDSLDPTGRFFALVTLAEGSNTFTVTARNTNGQMATTSLTLTGVAAGQPVDVANFQDVTDRAQLAFTATTFNRQTHILHADAQLVNISTNTLFGPVAAVFSSFTVPTTTLTGTPHVTPEAWPYLTYDSELPVGGLASTASSTAVRVGFTAEPAERFTFDLVFLGQGNRAPSFTSTPRGDAVVGKPYHFTATASDPDGDTVHFTLAIGPEGMTIDGTTGVVSWTPTASQSGQHQVELQVTDGRGGTGRQVFYVQAEVAPANRAPVFRSAPPTSGAADALYTYQPDVFDADGDSLTFTLDQGPLGMSVDSGTGELTFPTASAGSYAVTLRVADGQGGEAVQDFVLVIGGQGSAVAIVSTPPTSVVVGQQYAYQPAVEFTNPVTFTLVLGPTGVSFDQNTGLLLWTPTSAQLGPHTVILSAQDGLGGATTHTFTITAIAAAINRSPVITSAPVRLATRNVPYLYAAGATDPDGDTVTYSLSAAPAGMAIDSGTGVVNWTPGAAFLGSYLVTVVATDTHGATGQQSYLVEVRDVNTPAQITSTPVLTVVAGALYRYRLQATDTADSFTFSLGSGPVGMFVNQDDGLVRWQTTAADVGPHTVTLRTTDERGATFDQTFTLTVLADTVAPMVAIVPDTDVLDPGESVTIHVVGTDNVAVTQLTLSVNGVPVTLNPDGTYVYTATGPGVVRLTATARDAGNNVGTTAESLRVLDPSDTVAPAVTITSPQPEDLISYIINVTGSITDANLDTYRVEIGRVGSNEFRLIQESTTVPASGILATLDPTLLENDAYTLRVTAVDVNGRQTVVEQSLEMTGQAKIGNFRQVFSDLVIEFAGIPIVIQRVYDTLKADVAGDFGFGWSLGQGYDPRVRETRPINPAESIVGMFAATPFKDGTRVYVNTPDGRRVGFTFEAKPYEGVLSFLAPGTTGGLYMPYFRPDAGVFETLQGESDGDSSFPLPLQKFGDFYVLAGISVPYNPPGYRLTTKEGISYHFNQFTGLQDITDRSGNVLTFTENGIFSSAGSSIQFVRDSQGRITRIIDPAGNAITYEYDAHGDLVEVKDQEGVKSHFYYLTQPVHYLYDINNATGGCGCFTSAPPMRMEYDTAGRLSKTTDAFGQGTTYDYDLDDFTETMTDALGVQATIVYDVRGNVVEAVDPAGAHLRFTYDANDRPTSFTDGSNRTITRTFDGHGNLIHVIDPLNGEWSATYNDFNQLLTATDPLDRTWQQIYDVHGNLIQMIDPAGKNSLATYDDRGRIGTLTDASGYTTQFTYGNTNRPTTINNPDGTQSQLVYNFYGQATQIEDENGGITHLEYDDTGHLRVMRDALNNIALTFTYVGNLLSSVTDARGHSLQFEYDAANRRTSETDPDGNVTTWSYDANGRISAVTDRRDHTTIYAYREDGRLESVTDAANGVTSYQYDLAGNVIAVTDPNNHTTVYTYDALNRPIRETDHLGGFFVYAYDAVGNLLSQTDPNNHTTEYAYDELDRLVQTTDALNGVTTLAYDAVGNLSAATDANNHTTQFTYDSLNRQTGMVDAANGRWDFTYDHVSNLTGVTDPLGRTTSYTYDPLNRLVTTVDALGGIWTQTYDAVGNLTTTTNARGNTTQFTYDNLNRLATVTDALDGVTTYQYDAESNLTAVTDALNHTTHYTFDVLNRLTSQTNALDGVQQYDYDAASNLIRFTDELDRETTFGYDELNRLTSITDALNGVTQFGYDAAGNTSAVTDPLNRTAHFDYDAMDRLVSLTDPGNGVQQFGYDAVGNQTSSTDPLNRTTHYAFDNLNRVVSITDPRNSVTHLGYDAVGNLTDLTDPNNNHTAFTYDALDRLVRQMDPLGHSAFFGYDADSNLTSVTDRNGRVRTFAYDKLDRRTEESWLTGLTTVNTINYAYDAVGNLLEADDAFSHYTLAYDSLNRLTSVDNAGTPGLPNVILSYTHDAVGNTTRVEGNDGIQINSTYDPLNRLTQRTWQGGGIDPVSVQMDYDVASQRTELRRYADLAGTTLVSSTTFDFDLAGRLENLQHRDALAQTLVDYHYTYDLAGQLVGESHHGQSASYGFDLAGQLTSATYTSQAGEVYTYDANGNPADAGVVVGPANQILADSRFDYTYDAEGNLISKLERPTGNVTTYSYDHRNRLLAVEEHDGNGVLLHEVQYTYDLFDRRILQTVDGVTRATIYDGDHPWADYDATGQVVARYLFGDRIDEILARWRPGEGTAWYLTDHLGTVRDLINAVGVVVNHLDYDSFGQFLGQTNSTWGDRFTFTGREFEFITGLYYYRARYYDPQLHRFLSEDPMGFAAGDVNLYRYVANKPLTATDPSGMNAMVEYSIKVGAIAGALIGFFCSIFELHAQGRLGQPGALWEIAQATFQGALIGAGLGLGFGLLAPFWGAAAGLYIGAFLAGVGIGMELHRIETIARSNDPNRGAQIAARVGCLAVSLVIPFAVMRAYPPPRLGPATPPRTGCFVAGTEVLLLEFQEEAAQVEATAPEENAPQQSGSRWWGLLAAVAAVLTGLLQLCQLRRAPKSEVETEDEDNPQKLLPLC